MNERDAVEVDELRNKYYTETTVSVFLSQQEQQWMKEHAQITVGYLADYLPYCDKAEDGSATGLVSDIVPDLLDLIDVVADEQQRCAAGDHLQML